MRTPVQKNMVKTLLVQLNLIYLAESHFFVTFQIISFAEYVIFLVFCLNFVIFLNCLFIFILFILFSFFFCLNFVTFLIFFFIVHSIFFFFFFFIFLYIYICTYIIKVCTYNWGVRVEKVSLHIFPK